MCLLPLIVPDILTRFTTRLAIMYSRLRKHSPIHLYPVAEAAVVALICSCINYLIVYLRGDQVMYMSPKFRCCAVLMFFFL